MLCFFVKFTAAIFPAVPSQRGLTRLNLARFEGETRAQNEIWEPISFGEAESTDSKAMGSGTRARAQRRTRGRTDTFPRKLFLKNAVN